MTNPTPRDMAAAPTAGRAVASAPVAPAARPVGDLQVGAGPLGGTVIEQPVSDFDPANDLDRLAAGIRIAPSLAYRHFVATGVTSRVPRSVSLETTSACQLSCPMCDRDGMRRHALAMSDRVFAAVLDAIAPHRVKISFNGVGEPLLDRKLADRIAEARARGIPEAALVTNGLLLDENRIRDLIGAGVTRISVSLDGADQQSLETGHKGSDHDRVTENVETLLRLKRDLVADHLAVVLRVTLQRGNLAAAPAIYRRWHGRVSAIAPNFVYQYGAARTDSALSFDWDQRIPCPQMLSTMLVLTNGDATICCLGDINADLKAGNLTVDSLETCWDGPRAREIRALHRAGDLSTLPVCQRCSGGTIGNFKAGALAEVLDRQFRAGAESEQNHAPVTPAADGPDQEPKVLSKAPVSR